MAKSIPALITPSVLKWARELDSITVEEAATHLKVSIEKIESWGNGDAQPSLNQAKKLAKYYRIPFAYLYLPDEPKKTKRLDKVDYRTFGNNGIAEFSRELRWLIRDIEDRRDTIIDLYKESEITPKSLKISYSIKTDEKQLANAIRSFLGLDYAIQKKFRKAEAALSYCISKLEEKDFLIFQASKISPGEMRGLSIAYDSFPIIVLNRKDEQSARLFTLFHELVHIFTRTSGICNDMTNKSVYQLELFCNRIAGYALVPDEYLLTNPNLLSIQQYGIDDTYIYAIARDFGVSREVVINRLWNNSIIDQSTYYSTLNRYSEEYRNFKTKQKKGFLPPAMDKGTQVGKLYAKTILSAYYSEKITPREASQCLLGLKIQHFSTIERWCF